MILHNIVSVRVFLDASYRKPILKLAEIMKHLLPDITEKNGFRAH